MSAAFPSIARDRAVNRLDPAHLARWREYYDALRLQYRCGVISPHDAQMGLISLGYRDQALRVELSEFDRERSRVI
ncbi:hypothetical protein [Bradyrhizobium sp. 2S1]|uniref:hypothetical protein n=1 Tax=Bradyrhizobium sp. 2S1 TaxID=1404429 RepID=UPI00140C098C|nr:hypothetical protein [Bradyrhizobium sp. 2S1]MCK7672406.1 hypothetical protein [Bradyrhizobium sp. 2S1]